MKIFLDSASLTEIETVYETGLLSGVTTNPTLVRKSGANYIGLITHLARNMPELESISAEVNTGSVDAMFKEGMTFASIGEAVTVKVPLTPEGLKVCKRLSNLGVKTNVTLCFSAAQAVMAALAGATYVSPFVGRCNDNSFSGVELVRAISGLYRAQGVETQVLAASLRDVHHVSRCFLYGANVVTLPAGVFHKMYDHVLTREGLAIFNQDYKKING
jgi:transaldolase